jgi:regulatory protein
MPDHSTLLKKLQQEALRLLVRREHSRQELQQKLSQRLPALPEFADLDDTTIGSLMQTMLDGLGVKNWQSDERFAQQRVTHRGARYGNQRLKQELNQRGVDQEIISSALENGEDELERCRSVWQKKFGQAADSREEIAKDRAKQIRFLQYRGFSGEIIRNVMKSAALETDDLIH